MREKCYSGGMAIDDQQPNEVYCSVPVEGKYGKVYELIKYTIDDQGQVSETDTLTKDSELNNVRPFIIPNRKKSPLKLTWMYGNYYDWIVSKERPWGFCTSIYTDYNLKGEKADLDTGLAYEEAKPVEGIDRRTFYFPSADQFSIFLDLELDTTAYNGALISADQLTYGVEVGTMKPYLQFGENSYQSNNVLGNSDRWKEEPRGTGGQWYAPVKYSSVLVTLVYDGKELTIYLNGLVDQVVELPDFKAAEFKIGELAGKVRLVKLYNRKLNNTEISFLCCD